MDEKWSATIRVALFGRETMLVDALQRYVSADAAVRVVLRRDLDCAPNDLPSADVAVIDVERPGEAFSFVARWPATALPMRVIVIAAAADEHDVAEAIRHDIRALLLRSMPGRLLLDCIRRVHEGALWVERNATAILLRRELQRSRYDGLSDREIDVIRMVGSGLRNREVAEKLFIAESTVKVHLNRIYSKLALRNRVALSLYAREHGLV